jgi:hypothetical protein
MLVLIVLYFVVSLHIVISLNLQDLDVGIIMVSSDVILGNNIYLKGRNTEINLNGYNLLIESSNVVVDSVVLKNGNIKISDSNDVYMKNIMMVNINNILISGSTNVVLNNINIDDSKGIMINSSEYVSINDCIINNIDDGISVINSNSVRISDNEIINGINNGILVNNSSDVMLLNNIISKLLGIGIIIRESHNIMVKNVNMDDVDISCILLDNSVNNIIMNNVCNSFNGIVSMNNGGYNVIVSNIFMVLNIGIMESETLKIESTNKYSLNIFTNVISKYFFKKVKDEKKNIIYVSPFNNIDIGDYNCDGDNDAEVLHMALNYFNETFGEVRLLSGVFVVADYLTIPSNIILSGMGLDVTYLSINGIYLGNNTNIVSMTISNMVNGIMIYNVNNIYINKVHILDSYKGIYMYNSNWIRLFDSIIDNTEYSLYMEKISEFEIYNNLLYNCKYGMNINNINVGVISNNIINDNSYGMIVNNINENASLMITNNIIENLENIGIDLYNVNNLLFSKNQVINVLNCITMINSSYNLITSNICLSDIGVNISVNSYDNLISENSIKLLETGDGILNTYEFENNATNKIVNNIFLGDVVNDIIYIDVIIYITLLVNEILLVKTNNYKILETFYELENENIISFVNTTTNMLFDNIVVQMSIDITNTNYYPKNFEYTKLNNHNGIMKDIPQPTGGWKVGDNYIEMELLEEDYVDIDDINWSDMNRLQLYRSGAIIVCKEEYITFNYIRLQ